MEHLVQGHIYCGYYISNEDPELIETWCDTCGDCDRIVLSWEPENRFGALFEYLTKYEYSQENLIDNLFMGLSYEDLVNDIDAYYINREYILKELYEDHNFTKQEFELIKEQMELVKKEQLSRLNNIIIPEIACLRMKFKSRRVKINE